MNVLTPFFQTIYPLPAAARADERQQAMVLYAALSASLFTGLFTLPVAALSSSADLSDRNRALVVAIQILLLIGTGLAYRLARRSAPRSAAITLIVPLTVEAAATLLLWGNAWASLRGGILLLAVLLLSGLLLGKRIFNGTLALTLLLVLAVGVYHSGDRMTSTQAARWLDLGVLAVWGTAAAGVFYATGFGSQETVVTADSESFQHLISVGEDLSRSLFARSELDTILGQTVDGLVDRFPRVDHAQIFVIPSDNPQAVLRAATGPVGIKLVAQEYALDVGSLSAVGRATLTGQPLLIRDYERDPIHTSHPLNADMRSELAIPLRGSAGVIGALDVQSAQPDAFDTSIITVLQAIATQIATAIDSMHMYDEAQRSIRENQALYRQTQANLREIERLNFELTGRAWGDFLRQQADSAALTLDLDSGHITPESPWSAALDQAAKRRAAVETRRDGQVVVALPITIRNEVVGGMEFELDDDAELPPGVLELATAIGHRLGQAMENRRLFDETQRIAQREALINDIGSELQAATGVDAIIQRAAHHLQEALTAHTVSIRIGSIPDDGSRQGERS